MKKLTVLLMLCLTIASCTFNDEEEQQQTKLSEEAFAQVGMPAIKNFQEKKLAKMIFELRDQENLICYAYVMSLDGKLIFLGKCIGYGLPYSTQYTCPEQRSGNGTTLPQQDPNGLYMPTGTNATWVMLINPKTNKPQPVYVEQDLFISPFPINLK